MPKPSKSSISDLTAEVALSEAFERLRPRLVAMTERRVGSKLAIRVDPEGVVNEAYIRAAPRWRALDAKPSDIDAWVYGQVRDRLIELMRGALGPQRDVDRDLPATPLAEHLVDSHTRPDAAFSRDERREVVRAAFEKLDPLDREILALRYFDGLDFAQIGPVLGLSQNAVTKRGLRAMIKLRELIPSAFRPPEAHQP